MLYLIIDTIFSSFIMTLTFLKPLTEKIKFHFYILLFVLLFFVEILQYQYGISSISAICRKHRHRIQVAFRAGNPFQYRVRQRCAGIVRPDPSGIVPAF